MTDADYDPNMFGGSIPMINSNESVNNIPGYCDQTLHSEVATSPSIQESSQGYDLNMYSNGTVKEEPGLDYQQNIMPSSAYDLQPPFNYQSGSQENTNISALVNALHQQNMIPNVKQEPDLLLEPPRNNFDHNHGMSSITKPGDGHGIGNKSSGASSVEGGGNKRNTGGSAGKSRGIGIENTIQVPPNTKLFDIKAMYHSELGTVCIKDIKGVYKNCRGIWAAQWTDDNGQRHTKYFNPKYFASEESARVNAYKFKLDVQLTMERQKGLLNTNMPFLNRQFSNPLPQQMTSQGKVFESMRTAYQYGYEPPKTQTANEENEALVLTYAVIIAVILGFCGCKTCAKDLIPDDITPQQAGYLLRAVLDRRISSDDDRTQPETDTAREKLSSLQQNRDTSKLLGTNNNLTSNGTKEGNEKNQSQEYFDSAIAGLLALQENNSDQVKQENIDSPKYISPDLKISEDHINSTPNDSSMDTFGCVKSETLDLHTPDMNENWPWTTTGDTSCHFNHTEGLGQLQQSQMMSQSIQHDSIMDQVNSITKGSFREEICNMNDMVASLSSSIK